jgi:peptide/nickel transport system permease protein
MNLRGAIHRFVADAQKVFRARSAGVGPDMQAPGRFRWRLITRNAPFVLGMLILLFLLSAALFGPRFASQNPYLSAQRSAEMVDGELVNPPFAPSAEFPLGSDAWGRDILSLLLYGARNTLVACVFVTMVRLLLGVTLGALAGWRPGGWLDRCIMGMVEIMASLPILLTGMILIFALDIRRGLIAFLIGLSVVGWGEIAQYIRAEFISLRNQPFIEGARVIGLTEGGIARRHIFPNVLPQLVVLTLLEMGAVLMLLGELGFVGVFIGGGFRTASFDAEVVVADIPEWGAVLAGARAYIRSAPWMVLYPAMAFFLSVLGANLLGEGLRRIIRDAGVNTAALVSKRLILVVAVVSVATWYIVNQIGPGVSYAKLASQFDAENALQHAQTIVELQQDDAGFGTEGARSAAEYIARQFEAYGVLPAAANNSYLQPVTHQVARRLSVPELSAAPIQGGEWVSLTHGVDFGEQVYNHGGSGVADAPATFIAFGQGALSHASYRGLDLRGRVAVVLGDNRPDGFDTEALIRGAQAVVVITEQAAPHVDWADPKGFYMEQPTLPILHVRPEAAERLLQAGGHTLADLQALADRLSDDPADQLAADPVDDLSDDPAAEGAGQAWRSLDLDIRIRGRVELSAPETMTGYNVLGVLPGNDAGMAEKTLMLSTHYDLPEPDPQQPFLAASDGPGGVGIMLEMARLWQHEVFKPRRTVLFAVWAGGYHSVSGAATYLRDYTPYQILTREAVVHLGGASAPGAGDPTLLVSQKDSLMQDLLERSGRSWASL